MNHYSRDLPGYESNIEKASDIASDEVMTKSPHQQTPNPEMASSTNTDSVLIPDNNKRELDVPEQDVPEHVISNQSPATNTIAEPKITAHDQPSSSNLALQTCAPTRPKNIPSPPTLFLDFIILANVCENIFQELKLEKT